MERDAGVMLITEFAHIFLGFFIFWVFVGYQWFGFEFLRKNCAFLAQKLRNFCEENF